MTGLVAAVLARLDRESFGRSDLRDWTVDSGRPLTQWERLLVLTATPDDLAVARTWSPLPLDDRDVLAALIAHAVTPGTTPGADPVDLLPPPARARVHALLARLGQAGNGKGTRTQRATRTTRHVA